MTFTERERALFRSGWDVGGISLGRAESVRVTTAGPWSTVLGAPPPPKRCPPAPPCWAASQPFWLLVPALYFGVSSFWTLHSSLALGQKGQAPDWQWQWQEPWVRPSVWGVSFWAVRPLLLPRLCTTPILAVFLTLISHCECQHRGPTVGTPNQLPAVRGGPRTRSLGTGEAFLAPKMFSRCTPPGAPRSCTRPSLSFFPRGSVLSDSGDFSPPYSLPFLPFSPAPPDVAMGGREGPTLRAHLTPVLPPHTHTLP